jgi:hypothetical protein
MIPAARDHGTFSWGLTFAWFGKHSLSKQVLHA